MYIKQIWDNSCANLAMNDAGSLYDTKPNFMHYFLREIPQNHHTFASSLSFPKNGSHLMTPDDAWEKSKKNLPLSRCLGKVENEAPEGGGKKVVASP